MALINVESIGNFKIPTACRAMLQTSKTAVLGSDKNLTSQSSVLAFTSLTLQKMLIHTIYWDEIQG
jgi:hypothetical protein